jgi:hypothetical protein
MPEPASCDAIREALAGVVSAPGAGEPALDPLLAEHAASCESCRRALSGARALGRELATWTALEPPEGLAARTLVRVRRARLDEAEPASPPVPSPALPVPILLERGSSARRSSVELLALWALPGPRPASTARDRLGLRIAIQAAAAVLLFVLCTSFTVLFYPVVVLALEESRERVCQEHLARVGHALVSYRRDHPDTAGDPRGSYAIRDALVRGGYARLEDFECPAAARAGAGSFFLKLPEPNAPERAVLAWDQLGNHGSGINVVLNDGHIEHIDAERLGERLGPR